MKQLLVENIYPVRHNSDDSIEKKRTDFWENARLLVIPLNRTFRRDRRFRAPITTAECQNTFFLRFPLSSSECVSYRLLIAINIYKYISIVFFDLGLSFLVCLKKMFFIPTYCRVLRPRHAHV